MTTVRPLGERRVLRLRHARVVAPLADGDPGEQPADQVLVGGGELGQEPDLLAGYAEVGLRLEVDALTDDDVDVEAVLRGVDGEVAAGVAGADDEDPVALDVAGVAVRAGVDLLAGEVARDLRDLLVPEVAVGDQDAVVVDAARRCRG